MEPTKPTAAETKTKEDRIFRKFGSIPIKIRTPKEATRALGEFAHTVRMGLRLRPKLALSGHYTFSTEEMATETMARLTQVLEAEKTKTHVEWRIFTRNTTECIVHAEFGGTAKEMEDFVAFVTAE